MRVLVVDDHPLFREGIVSLLSARHVDVVGEAGDGLEGVVKAEALRPDVVLMDIRMPGMGGLEATRLLKQRLPDMKIVILTISDDDEDLFEAIKSGADGYLLKDVESDEFFRLLNGVPAGEPAVTPPLAVKILREFARSRSAAPASATEIVEEELTPREREVLEALAGGATNKEIAQALYIAESTVKYHVTNIMDKLHFRTRGQAIAYATRRGSTPRRPPSD